MSTVRPPVVGAARLDHLGLDELRDYRQDLIHEEAVVSYWRRVVHARIDGGHRDGSDHKAGERLKSVLAEHQRPRRRRGLMSYDGNPPPAMPDLAVLWESEADGPGEQDADRLHRLTAVEAELSTYRRNLYARLDAATRELIARYRTEPALALRALPGSGRRGAA